MAKRIPKEGRQADLKEFTWYDVRLESLEVQPASKFGTSIKAVYAIADGTVWDFLNYIDTDGNAKLGKSPNGGVSRFRSWCNALGGRPEATRVAYFDDETMLIVWPDGGDLTLEPGLELRVLGELRDRGDDDGSVFRVTKYRPVEPNDTPEIAF